MKQKYGWVTGCVVAACLSFSCVVCGAEEAAAEDEEAQGHRGGISAGLTLNKGNSDNEQFNAGFEHAWEGDPHIWNFGASMTYATSDDKETTEKESGYIQYKRLLNGRPYLSARLDALHDGLADIEYRVTVGPLFGYFVVKNEKAKVSVEVGPSFVAEKLGAERKDYFALRFAEACEYGFEKQARVWHSAEYVPQLDDFNNYLLKAEIGAEATVVANFGLRIVLKDEYNNKPAEGKKKNDLTLISGLVYNY